MKTILYITIASLLILQSCGEDYKAKYDEKLNQFKTEKLAALTEKFEQIKTFKKVFVEMDSVRLALVHKEYKIELEHINGYHGFNTIFMDSDFFTDEAERTYNLTSHTNLDEIERLINGEDLQLFDPQTPSFSISLLKKFIEYCDYFLDAEYLMMQGEINSVFPLLESNGTYINGEMVGLFCLFDLKTNQLLDNFVYTAENSPEINYSVSQDQLDVVINDFFKNISFAISEEATVRYSINENSFIPLLINN